MTDSKNTESQELSLDQLTTVAGGDGENYCEIELTAEGFKTSKPKNTTSLQQNIRGISDPGRDSN